MSTDKGKHRDTQGRFASRSQETIWPNTPSGPRSLSPTIHRTMSTQASASAAPPRSPDHSQPDTETYQRTNMSGNGKVKINTDGLIFSGKKADYRKWRNIVDLYVIGNSSSFDSEKKKIAFVLSYMCGSKMVTLWSSNKQEYFAATKWPTWSEFAKMMDKDFSDPATKAQAHEFLRTFRQKSLSNRALFETLDLWVILAGLEPTPEGEPADSDEATDSQAGDFRSNDENLKFEIAKRSMDPGTRKALTMKGFPTSSVSLRDKLVKIEDADREMLYLTPSNLDSRFIPDSGTSTARQVSAPHHFGPSKQQFRVQGHSPTDKRLTYRDILKLPKGQRPRPSQPCFTCRDLNVSANHWRDECPYQRGPPNRPLQGPSQPVIRPAPPRPQRNFNKRPPQGQRAQQLHQNSPRNHRDPAAPNPHRFRRQNETSEIEDARRALGNLSTQQRADFIIQEAKAT